MAEQLPQCSKMHPSVAGPDHQCRNRGRYTHDGKPYCLLHDPSKATRQEARTTACVNAFHSPTRTIPTEQISEGLVWKLYDALRAIAKALDAPRNRFGKLETDFAQGADLAGLLTQLKPDFPDIIPHGGEDNIDQTVMVIRALLDSLKVEEPE